MDKTFIAIDGSSLFFQIAEIWRKRKDLKGRKIKLGLMSSILDTQLSVEGAVLRMVYYFKQNDSRIEERLDVPNFQKPGLKNKWLIDECGISIRTLPESVLLKIPQQYRDIFPRAEKGLDIKLTCDVLSLLSTGKVSTIALFINDRDYIPLLKAIQYLGGNVYLIGLHSDLKIRTELKEFSDRFITFDNEIEGIFGVATKQEEYKVQEVRP